MWKRDEAVRSPAPAPSTPPAPATPVATASGYENRLPGGRDVVNIGKSIVIKGELAGDEDLTIEGQVEGRIELKDHSLTIGPNGRIRAAVFAKSVIVLGEIVGNVTATDKVDLRDKGSVDGDIISPRVAIAEGAHFRGSVDMKRSAAPAQATSTAAAKPESRPGGAGPSGMSSPQGPQKVGA